MVSGKKPIACIPCAKRKVRCDRLQPCSHCRRRSADRCTYPVIDPSDDRKRIRELEILVDRLRGQSTILQGDASNTFTKNNSAGGDGQSIPRLVQADCSSRCTPSGEITGNLVPHHNETSYIETPMWYSWNAVNEENEHNYASSNTGMTNKKGTGQYVQSILEKAAPNDNECLTLPKVLNGKLALLWSKFLENVHPLVNIFFIQDISPMINKSVKSDSLTNVESALLLSICFVAVISLEPNIRHSLFPKEENDILLSLQHRVECALHQVGFIVTTNLRVLQAFMLYMIAIRYRAQPAALYSLMGVAVRMAERMGVHRDGEKLGLSIRKSEERRRVWWHLQYMEIITAKLVGTVPMTLYANWDASLPANVEEKFFTLDTKTMPQQAKELTSISHCLWRYQILSVQRERQQNQGAPEGLSWLLSSNVSTDEKNNRIDELEDFFAQRYLRYCDLLDPLHVYIQIGIRQILLAARKAILQPKLINAKISEMDYNTREQYLDMSTKCLGYYTMSRTNEQLTRFRWDNENQFQWISFIYVVLEAHLRSNEESTRNLWKLLENVWTVHPTMRDEIKHSEKLQVARMILKAWQEWISFLQVNEERRPGAGISDQPEWIRQLVEAVNSTGSQASDSIPVVHNDILTGSQFLPDDFDFDLFDWISFGTFFPHQA